MFFPGTKKDINQKSPLNEQFLPIIQNIEADSAIQLPLNDKYLAAPMIDDSIKAFEEILSDFNDISNIKDREETINKSKLLTLYYRENYY